MSKYTRARYIASAPRYCPTTGKSMFDKRGATSALNLAYKLRHERLRVYQCPECSAWHLTSRL